MLWLGGLRGLGSEWWVVAGIAGAKPGAVVVTVVCEGFSEETGFISVGWSDPAAGVSRSLLLSFLGGDVTGASFGAGASAIASWIFMLVSMLLLTEEAGRVRCLALQTTNASVGWTCLLVPATLMDCMLVAWRFESGLLMLLGLGERFMLRME